MRVRRTLFTCSLSTAVACAGQAPDLAQTVEATAKSLYALNATPGLGVAVVHDGRVVYAGGFGYADVETGRPFMASTPFYIASATKSFTGLTATILAERGIWSLDAPVTRYLPRLRLHPPLDPDSITIRQLLTHTHGISNDGPVVLKLAYTGDYAGNDELIALLTEHPPERTGRAYVYGNIGYNVATLAMDAETRESWKETLRRTLFEPLGMRGTTAYASRVDTAAMARPYRATPGSFVRIPLAKNDATMQSAGGMFSTPSDMGVWLEAHIGGGRIDGRQILPSAAVAETHRILATMDQRRGAARLIGYGLGWQIGLIGRDTILMHGGGFAGYATVMSFMPRRRSGVVVMANNSELGGGFVSLAMVGLYDVLRTGRPMSPASLAALKAQVDRRRTQLPE
jgi:CubicO group peptidase (beta-lactamase class C family)